MAMTFWQELDELRARVAALETGATCPHIISSHGGTSYCDLALQTAAAQPDPQGPTDEELDAVWFAARWGRPAQSKPQEPTDEELDTIWFASGSGVDGREWRTFARDVLARWGRP